jgi:hypothetical protein
MYCKTKKSSVVMLTTLKFAQLMKKIYLKLKFKLFGSYYLFYLMRYKCIFDLITQSFSYLNIFFSSMTLRALV